MPRPRCVVVEEAGHLPDRSTGGTIQREVFDELDARAEGHGADVPMPYKQAAGENRQGRSGR